LNIHTLLCYVTNVCTEHSTPLYLLIKRYLCASAFSRKATLSFLPSVCQHLLKSLTRDGFPQNLIFRTLTKICQENLIFLKISREYRALYQQLQESPIAAVDINSPQRRSLLLKWYRAVTATVRLSVCLSVCLSAYPHVLCP
jgi:hypothetical protein